MRALLPVFDYVVVNHSGRNGLVSQRLLRLHCPRQTVLYATTLPVFDSLSTTLLRLTSPNDIIQTILLAVHSSHLSPEVLTQSLKTTKPSTYRLHLAEMSDLLEALHQGVSAPSLFPDPSPWPEYNMQSTSPLMTLPLEIRNQILEYVLRSEDFNVYADTKTFTPGVLQTCRRLRDEYWIMFYSRNLFEFRSREYAR